MPLTIQEMSDHVNSLLVEHNIEVGSKEQYLELTGQELRPNNGIAFAAKRIIFIWGVRTEREYFTALHEIGHIVTDDEDHFDQYKQLLIAAIDHCKRAHSLKLLELINLKGELEIRWEIAASDWAKSKAIEWTKSMDELAVYALKTHLYSLPFPGILGILNHESEIE